MFFTIDAPQVAALTIAITAIVVVVCDRQNFSRLCKLTLVKAFIMLSSLGYVSVSFNAMKLFACTR